MAEVKIPSLPDLETLLAPIAAGNPAGEDLRYEGTYDHIQEARREDDPTLEQGIWKTKLKQADWKAAHELCAAALTSRTKDLQIAAWLTEAWVQLHGFAGLRKGLELILGLCERYWDEAHPRIKDNDIEFRLAPFNWLNEKLLARLKQIHLTRPHTHDGEPYNALDWEKALRNENLAKSAQSGKMPDQSKDTVTTAKILSSASLTPGPFFSALAKELHGATSAIDRLSKLLDQKCGKDSPSLEQLKKSLVSIQTLTRELGGKPMDQESSFAQEAAPERQAHSPSAEPAQCAPPGGEAVPAAVAAAIQNRAQAYRALEEIAEFLLRTEPHSPTPYLIKRAVAWGNMTLGEVLQDLVQDQGNLEFINELLGLNLHRKGG